MSEKYVYINETHTRRVAVSKLTLESKLTTGKQILLEISRRAHDMTLRTLRSSHETKFVLDLQLLKLVRRALEQFIMLTLTHTRHIPDEHL